MTATADKLAARAEELPEGSTRRRVLEGARRFKAAWLDFARLLAEVRRDEHWREWGYPSFDRYCASELFIKRSTAEKLTASYGFLERHEPRLAEGQGDGLGHDDRARPDRRRNREDRGARRRAGEDARVS